MSDIPDFTDVKTVADYVKEFQKDRKSYDVEVIKVKGVVYKEVGVGVNKEDAENSAKKLESNGWMTYIVPLGTVRSKGAYLVYIGPYDASTFKGV